MACGWIRWIRICIPRYHSVLTPTKRVITVAPMPPEKSAYALARYSRSPDSIRDSIEWVRTHNSQKFLESFYFQYGHASIADLGHTVHVLRRHLRTGRHRDRRRAALGRPGQIVALPGFFALRLHHAARTRGRCRRGLSAPPARRCWPPTPRSRTLAFAALCERLPRPEDMKPDAYQRNLAARAFDVARYLLFWGVPTNVGQVASIRTLEKQIRRLKASEYAELRSLGDEIAQACAALPDCVWDAAAQPEPLAPTLARHADADEHAAQIPRGPEAVGRAESAGARRPRGRPRRPGAPHQRPRRYRRHAALPGHRPPVPRAVRAGLRLERAAARRSDRRGAAIAHAARRDSGRLPRRACTPTIS